MPVNLVRLAPSLRIFVSGLRCTFLRLAFYLQHHYTNQFEAGAKALGFDVPAYHGLTVFEAESYEKIMEVFTSEEYARICQPEEKNYLDRAKTGFFPGSIVTFIDKKN